MRVFFSVRFFISLMIHLLIRLSLLLWLLLLFTTHCIIAMMLFGGCCWWHNSSLTVIIIASKIGLFLRFYVFFACLRVVRNILLTKIGFFSTRTVVFSVTPICCYWSSYCVFTRRRTACSSRFLVFSFIVFMFTFFCRVICCVSTILIGSTIIVTRITRWPAAASIIWRHKAWLRLWHTSISSG